MGDSVLGSPDFPAHEGTSPGIEGPTGVVAVLAPDGEDPSRFYAAVEHGSGVAVAVSGNDLLPADAGALLVIGTSPFDGKVPPALMSALSIGTPVLGVGWGMHALNVALGGKPPVPVPQQDDGKPRLPVFMSPGAKLSYTIAGSGWVSVPFSNVEGVRPAELAPDVLASCYREDGFVAAFELPGRKWVIGVQWYAHDIDSLPSGFDSLLLALVERAAGIQ